MKMEFLHKVLKILNVLNIDCPEPFGYGPASTYQNGQWKSNYFDCRDDIINHLDNSLYSVFAKYKTAKELWEALSIILKMQEPKNMRYKNFGLPIGRRNISDNTR